MPLAKRRRTTPGRPTLIKFPPALLRQVDRAARLAHTNRSAWVRQRLFEALEDAIDVADSVERLANAREAGEKPVPWNEVKRRFRL